MPKYANQKQLEINKTIGERFLQINQLDWKWAFKQLSPTGFAVYLYIAENQNGYKFDYSPQAIANTGLMDRSTAQKKYTELVEKGFIVDGVFYTRPPRYIEELERKKNEPLTEDEI